MSDGDTVGAVELWKQARKNAPDAVQPRILLARHYRMGQSTALAEQVIDEAYGLAPDSGPVQMEYVLVKMLVGAVDEASCVAQVLIERYPNNHQLLELRAQVYASSGDAEGLETPLVKIVEHYPSATKSQFALGNIYVRKKRIC